jgi:predicted nicotinamide N-methyase
MAPCTPPFLFCVATPNRPQLHAPQVLGSVVVRRHHEFSGRRVVELGCGAGLAGVVASRFAAQVVFTDGNAECLPLALLNAVANGSVEAGAGAGVPASTPASSSPSAFGAATVGTASSDGASSGGVTAATGTGAEGKGGGVSTGDTASCSCGSAADSAPVISSLGGRGPGPCSVGASVLLWGTGGEVAVVERHGHFDVVLASECLYIHWVSGRATLALQMKGQRSSDHCDVVRVGAWVCGCLGVWVPGCVGAWVCGEVVEKSHTAHVPPPPSPLHGFCVLCVWVVYPRVRVGASWTLQRDCFQPPRRCCVPWRPPGCWFLCTRPAVGTWGPPCVRLLPIAG